LVKSKEYYALRRSLKELHYYFEKNANKSGLRSLW